MFIDPHVHLRDFNESHKETIAHGLAVARDAGVDAVFDMPNTDPPVTTRETVEARLKIAKEAGVPEVFYGVYMGLTADPEQIKLAVETYRALFPCVVGMKLYAGPSVGNLGVTRFENQQQVYEMLATEGYDGVLAVHAEKESRFRPNVWNPREPVTHCYTRPEIAEFGSVGDQLNLMRMTGFKGKLHITHVSIPAALEIIQQAKRQSIDVSCGVCPHHLMYDYGKMSGRRGLLWKMNPPLRSQSFREQIGYYLKKGLIDWLETDHAPHTLDDKLQPPYCSGIPGLPWWPLFDRWLEAQGFSEQQRADLTFNNAARRFGIDIKRKNMPTKNDHRGEYAFNPYESIEHQLGWQPRKRRHWHG